MEDWHLQPAKACSVGDLLILGENRSRHILDFAVAGRDPKPLGNHIVQSLLVLPEHCLC